MNTIRNCAFAMICACLFLADFAASKLISNESRTKTLVVLDNWATIETHSMFFNHLSQTLGHDLEYAMASVGPHMVKHYDEYYFDNIIFMSPASKETEIADGLSVKDIVEFFEHQGHNLMVFGDIDSRRHVRKLGNAFGVDFEPYHLELRNNSRGDSFAGSSPQDGEIIRSNNFFEPLSELHTPIFQFANQTGQAETRDKKVLASVAFKGIGAILDDSNQFVFPMLRAEKTTYSATQYEPTDDNPSRVSEVSGEQLVLVAGYQSRNNHRATFAGSMQMCSDSFMLQTIDEKGDQSVQSSTNYQFCRQLLNWVFQESGILRATNLRHNKKGDMCTAEDLSECNANPENYMLEDHVEFYIDLEQKTDGVWAPFIADDVQLQFTMLEPYYQVTMQREPGTDSVYSYKFRVPQRLGIYRFVVDYSRYGLTFLDEQSEVSIIQWRHDAFPRYLTRAFPFYLTVFVLMASFFLFIVAFLFSDLRGLGAKRASKLVSSASHDKKD